ncbi:hypothetical protein [Leptolyngbya sp. 7M]|uniref:hypothetical protein n=1 Tax=Leptolyngbya sp. 7M TaxID=2812896 RepID=UPI001B8BE1A7|nr:hypothetical protein [Leptolyngbya sp. 7M]QYO66313.1 hypothetical protein JVX88_05800 [Leptolyngbya sp. 7M]
MKVVFGSALFALFVTVGYSQQARVIAELGASTDRIVKNAPFSAIAVSESVQVLPDGNRIVRTSTTKMFRNSEGRFRRETTDSIGGLYGAYFSTGPGITILDPVAGRRLILDEGQKVATAVELNIADRLVTRTITTNQGKSAEPGQKESPVKVQESQVSIQPARRAAELAAASREIAGAAQAPGFFTARTPFESKTEQLGKQIFEGVEAEGVRTITTIPTGAIGNERPIEIVFERWYSPELQLTLYSKHYDPRFGEQTYTIKDLIRAEPDPSLFSLPSGYKIAPEKGAVNRVGQIQQSGFLDAQALELPTVLPA